LSGTPYAAAGDREITPEYLDANPPLTGWSNEVLPELKDLASQFQPDLNSEPA
jgi:hypothetical protein